MSEKDRFSLKGLLTILKGPFADQNALMSGIDITSLGFDLNSTELVLLPWFILCQFYVILIYGRRLGDTLWSPWDDQPMRRDIPRFTLPDCYQVLNVQPIENKLSNFSDETLMFMFYSNPQDIQQMIAAQELWVVLALFQATSLTY
jgi:CCR4-NOT transcription complex subunit 2